MSDEILEYIKESVDRIESKQDKHGDRITAVENWQSNANGKITVLTAIGVFIGGFVTWIIDSLKH